jgi:hypothetical protein
VQQHVKNAQKGVKENKAWNSAKNFAEPALMPVASVQMNAEV